MNFKLNNQGDAIGLFARDGTVIDFVEFGPQTNDVAMGRIPDGGVTVDFLSMATPRPNNVGNTAPVLAPIPDQAVMVGYTLTFSVSATDADPQQTLSFSLGAGAPPGASIDSASGQFTWTPASAPSTTVFNVIVTDNGVPRRSASQTVTVTVYTPPALTGIQVAGSQFSFGFSTLPGRTYQVEYRDSLAAGSWIPLGSPIAGNGQTITITADVTQAAYRFYRVTVH